MWISPHVVVAFIKVEEFLEHQNKRFPLCRLSLFEDDNEEMECDSDHESGYTLVRMSFKQSWNFGCNAETLLKG